MTAKHAGNEIGAIGEDFVEWLCQRPFGKDFLYRGQQYMTDKGQVELCDLLLLLEDTAILFEVKTALREKKADWSDEQWADWANARLEKALSQVERGCNALLGGLVVSVENERQGVLAIDPSRIAHVYCVAVVDHPTLDKWGAGSSFECESRTISAMTTTHAELQHIVTELSTAGDFIDYLQAREAFFAKNQMMGISELDLLAFYKSDPEEFLRHIENADVVIVGEGCWDEFAKLECRQQRDVMDQPSLIIDGMLDILHESRHAKLPHIEERRAKLGEAAAAGDAYATLAAEMAKIRRMDRRVIGQKLIEKSQKCVEQNRDRWFCSMPGDEGGPTFVFLVSTDDREQRMRSLECATWGGKLATNAKRVIGIATEPVTGGHGFSVDGFMVDQDPEVDRKTIPQELQNELLEQFGAPRRAECTEFGGDDTGDD